MELTREQFIELKTALRVCDFRPDSMVFSLTEALMVLNDQDISNYVTHYLDEMADKTKSLRQIAPQLISDIETELILG